MPSVILVQPPAFLQQGEYSARLTRNFLNLVATEGVTGSSEFAVTERAASPAMQVDVAAGRAFIDGDDIPNQFTYVAFSEDVVEITVEPADTVDDRIDLVVVRVLDSDAGVIGDDALIEVITGTPDPSPVVPATPPTALPLASIDVVANAATITNSDITDLRVQSLPAFAAPVQSVNAQTGTVVLDASDVGAYADTNPSAFVDAAGAAAAAPVQSVNTQTGAVSLAATNLSDVTITTPAAGQILKYNGTQWVNLEGFAYVGTRTFTATGTFDKTDAFGDSSNVSPRAIVMTLVGAGGGGGGAGVTISGESAAGGGGSGGAVGIHVLDSVTIDTVLLTTTDVIVGAGGAGGVGAAAGTAGGNTEFQTFGLLAGNPTANGGGGGSAGTATNVGHIRSGGAQGVANDCNVENMRGSGGFASLSFVTTPFGGVGGQGGGNALAGATASVNEGDGADASFPGGGGGGARNPASRATARNGAPGRRGIVIMDIYV
jgi:hypothetical protein